LTPENTVKLLKNMAKGNGFTPGPQISERVNCEGIQGRSSLDKSFAHPLHTRDFGKEKEEYLAKQEEARKAAEAKK
jgi:hypothetical protein